MENEANALCSWSCSRRHEQVKGLVHLPIVNICCVQQHKPCEGRANSLILVCLSSAARRDANLSSRTIWSSLKFLSFWCPSFFFFHSALRLLWILTPPLCSLHKKSPIGSFVCSNLHLLFFRLFFLFFLLLCSWMVRGSRSSETGDDVTRLLTRSRCFCPLQSFVLSCFQDFPLLQLGDVVNDQSNIVGFSMLNTSHPFYLEFIRSLNLSWKEGCTISPYPGPAVRQR